MQLAGSRKEALGRRPALDEVVPPNPRSSGELCTPWPHVSMLFCLATEHGTHTTIPRVKPAGSGMLLSELYPMMPVGGGKVKNIEVEIGQS